MEWYIPVTILPGVGMLILSTTGQMMTLSAEIADLLSNKCTAFQHKIADLKIVQLNRLTKAAAMLYVSAASFVLSTIVGALLSEYFVGNNTLVKTLPNYILIIGVLMVLIALFLLISYGFHAIKIRKTQHEQSNILN